MKSLFEQMSGTCTQQGAVSVDIQSSLNVLMSHYRLDHLDVALVLAKPCAEGVSQVVCGEVLKGQRLSLFSLRIGSLFLFFLGG